MFEIGKQYTITTLVPGGEGWTDSSGVYKVLDFQGTLLKLEGHGATQIVNTASLHFICASLWNPPK